VIMTGTRTRTINLDSFGSSDRFYLRAMGN
jgi:hypothetical protein